MMKIKKMFVVFVIAATLSGCGTGEMINGDGVALNLEEEDRPNLIETNSYSKEEEIVIDDMIFKNFDVIYTGKSLPEYAPKNEVIYFDEQVDFRGYLMDDFTYCFITITLENTTDEEIEEYLSFGLLVDVDEQGKTIARSEEVRYRSDYVPIDPTGKDYYRCVVEAKSESTFIVGYILQDSMLTSERLYYEINRYGEWFSPTNFRYIKVDL
ncbi:MAG: hypothetical protein FWE25_07555 [Lachnospiraceae bacterium]|nr:hypothetical protein [Lachnospiraceae bacterium]